MPNCVGESFSPWQTAQTIKRCRSQFVLIAFNLKLYSWYQAGDFACPGDEGKWFIACSLERPFEVSRTPLFDSPEALCIHVVKTFQLVDTLHC